MRADYLNPEGETWVVPTDVKGRHLYKFGGT